MTEIEQQLRKKLEANVAQIRELQGIVAERDKTIAELHSRLVDLAETIIDAWEHPTELGELVEVTLEDEWIQGLVAGLHRHVPESRGIIAKVKGGESQ